MKGRILGIDPGTGITGYGVLDVDGQDYRIQGAGVIRTPPNMELSKRLGIIFDALEELIKEYQPDVFSVEKLFFAQNVTTAISVSHARGVVLLAADRANLGVFEYTPLQVKQALTGYGRAGKQQIQEMVKVILKLPELPKPDDCADALATAICHAMSIR